MRSGVALLIQVAASDGAISDTEARIIRQIAHANGLPASEVNDMLDHPTATPAIGSIPAAERFNTFYLIIQMMKADGQTYTSEVQFCERIAFGLGYRPDVVRAIADQMTNDPTIAYNHTELKRRAEKFAVRA